MKNTSKSSKLLSFIMAFLILLVSLPTYALASLVPEDTSQGLKEAQTTALPEEEGVYVLEEDISLREENVKHFKLSNGTVKAVSYANAVHYLDAEGNWIDIDNSLTLNGSEYTANNKQKIKFANKSGSNGLLSIKDGEYKIDFTPLNTNKVSVEIENPQKNNSRKFDDVKKLNNIVSRATYKGIYEGIDLEYILVGNNIKENIIVNEKQDTYSYSFEIKLNKLKAELVENSIILSDYDTGEKVYEIPAPYMVDANGEYSDNVEYSLVQDSKWKYTFTVKADPEWINEEERQLPVKIDPTVLVNTFTSHISDTFIMDEYDYSNYNYMIVGNFMNSYFDVLGFIKFESLLSIPENSILVEAELNTYISYVERLNDVNLSLGVFEATSDKWETKPTASLSEARDWHSIESTDVTPITTAKEYGWNITALYEKWIKNENTNKGVCIKAIGLSQTDSANVRIQTTNHSEDYSRPKLEITYRDIIGVEDYYAYLENTLGDVGKSYVNLYNGALTYVNHLTSIEVGPNLTYDIDMVYNSIEEKWTPSFNESITMIDYNTYDNESVNDMRDDVYYWRDEDGTSHAFTIYMEKNYWGEYIPYNIETGNLTQTWNPQKIFYPEDDIDYVLIKTENDEYILRDYQGNQKMFDSQGRLSKICDAQGNLIHFSYKNGNLSCIDCVKLDNIQTPQVEFTYNTDNKLSTIYIFATKLEISLDWSNNGLSKIEYNDIDNTKDRLIEIYYKENSNLIDKMSDNTESTYIEYDSNTSAKITSVWFYDNNGAPQSRYNIYRGEQYIVYTDHGTDLNSMTDNVRERFEFDKKGRKTTQSESAGSSWDFTLIDTWAYIDSQIPDISYYRVEYSDNINNKLTVSGNEDAIVRYNVGTGQEEHLSISEILTATIDLNVIPNLIETLETENLSSDGENIVTPAYVFDDEYDREIVTNTSQEPYSAICFLHMYFGNSQYRGSGFLIGPNLLLTVAHNLYDDGTSDNTTNPTFATSIDVYPGATKDPNSNWVTTPYEIVGVESFYIPKKYYEYERDNNNPLRNDYDWGICILDSNIGYETGWLDIDITPNDISSNVNIIGFPGNGKFNMYSGEGEILGVTDYKLLHTADAETGSSGSPVFIKGDENYIVQGVLSAQDPNANIGDNNIGRCNVATRINLLIYTLVMIL